MRIIIEMENEVVKTIIETKDSETAQVIDEQTLTAPADAGSAPSFGLEDGVTFSDQEDVVDVAEGQEDAGSPPADLVELLGSAPGEGTLKPPSSLDANNSVASDVAQAIDDTDGGGAPVI